MDSSSWADRLDGATNALLSSYRQVLHITQTDETTDPWALVQMRRTLVDQFGDVSKLIGETPGTSDIAALRKTFLTLRAALAEHQALWPAITMQADPVAYRRSLDGIDVHIQNFLQESRRTAIEMKRSQGPENGKRAL